MKESRDEERLGGARSSAAKGSESSSSSLSSSSAPSSSSLSSPPVPSKFWVSSYGPLSRDGEHTDALVSSLKCERDEFFLEQLRVGRLRVQCSATGANHLVIAPRFTWYLLKLPSAEHTKATLCSVFFQG